MSENHSSNRDRKKEDAPDFCGSLGKGMLVKDDMIQNSSGLIPLGFDLDVKIGNMNSEATEKLENLSGLSPLRPLGEIQTRDLRGYLGAPGGALKNSPGLTPLLHSKYLQKRGDLTER